MFGALKALSNSEKAVAIGLLVICATAMVFTGYMTVDTWVDYTEWMAVVYAGSKTVQGSVDSFARRGQAASAEPPAPPAPPAE